MPRSRPPRFPLLHLLLAGATLIAGTALPACSPGNLDRTSAKTLIDEHIGASFPLAHVDIPLDFLLSTQPRLTAGSDVDVALEPRLPDGTPPLRRAEDCTVRLLPSGSQIFSSILGVTNFGGAPFLRLELRNPIARRVTEVTGMVEHPMSASIRQVEYTWTYPLPDELATIRCRVVLTDAAPEQFGPPTANAKGAKVFEVAWPHPPSPLKADKATVSLYDDGWRVGS